jgi:uncharacterized SAM-binding protein YcdF (DUF218 family)
LSRGRKLALWLSTPLVFAGGVAGSSSLWLPGVGGFLEEAGPPRKADVILVLAGDWTGGRVLRAAELARQGWAPQVMVSGAGMHFGRWESDLAIEMAGKAGYSRSMFIPVPSEDHSTREEAFTMIRELRRRGLKRVLLVTTDSHTRRAGRIYRELADGIELAGVVASPSPHFQLKSWWRDREGQKAVFLEWSKTVAGWLGI